MQTPITLATATLLFAFFWHTETPAQAPPPPPKPLATPADEPPPQPASRERRAQAYAKLLEGQRHLLQLRNVREEEAMPLLQQARQAFQEAVKLDPSFAEPHTALARMAFEFPPQDLELAEREAAIAVKLSPNNVGAQHILGRFYTLISGLRLRRANRPAAERAIAALKELVRLTPQDSEGWALLGELSLLLGRPEEAVKAFTRWTSLPAVADSQFFQFVTNGRILSPDVAYSRLGEALVMAGRPTEAAEAVRRAMTLAPESEDYPRQLVRTLEAAGDSQKAIKEMERIVAASPGNGEMLRLLARMKANAGQVEEAAALLRQALTKLPASHRERPLLRLALAQIYANASYNKEAVAVYQEMLTERGIGNDLLQEEDPREFAATILGTVLDLQKNAGDYQAAEATIERLGRLLGPADSTAQEQQIELLRETGRRAEALEAVRAARAKFPDEDLFGRIEASVLAELGRVDEAVKILRARLTGTPNDYNEYLYICFVLTQARRGPEAVEAGKKALSLIPPDLPQRDSLTRQALLVLATAQERAGDRTGSESSLRRVLLQEPNNTTALNNLGYFLLDGNSERLLEALDLIKRAVRAEPDNASFLDSLGWAYFKMDNLAEAERHLTAAARRNPVSATIQEHLGDLYHKQGKPEEARVAWQKALKLTAEPEAPARLKVKLERQTK